MVCMHEVAGSNLSSTAGKAGACSQYFFNCCKRTPRLQQHQWLILLSRSVVTH
jgi:hypothetical protein